MATGVYVPIWGLQMEEATVARWIKAEGDPVTRGEGIVVIETYKISGEVESPVAGVLRRQVGTAGRTLKVGALLAVIGATDEREDAIIRVIREKPFVTDALVTRPKTRETAGVVSADAPEPPSLQSTAGGPRRRALRATPLARKIAKERGIDLSRVTGTGEGGRIYRPDVEAAEAPPARRRLAPPDRVVPLSTLRRAIIAKTMETVGIPYGALSREVRVDNLLAFRRSLAAPFERRYGLKLSLTHLFFKAAALALEEAPELNATLHGDRMVLRGAKNIGMVVTSPGGGGILIPVIRDVETKSVDQIAREWAAISERVERRALSFEDLSGGTFTISNVGPAGIDVFTPLIHPPESAILGITRMREVPLVDRGQVVVGQTLSLVVGADHRVTDADPIGVFLTAMDRLLQNPTELILP